MTVSTASPMGVSDYDRRVEGLRAQYAALPPGTPVRLAKKTSNLFRTRGRPTAGLDASGFAGVISIDPDQRTADVGGLTTYEDLVDATLAHGLMPLVVPELKTITLGGAVTGLGIESSSFRNGMPHESVLEFDVLTGDGQVVTARPEGEHRNLFFGFPNSYGTLGYALRLRIELEPVHPYVHLRHVAFGSVADLVPALVEACGQRSYDGEAVDFVDGTVFGPGECYLTLGSWTDDAPIASDYTRTQIYYRSLPRRRQDWLTVRDYLWRWDSDWFWCSRAFGVQRPWVRRLIGPRWLRSDVYWRIVNFEERHRFKATADRLLGRPPRENVIQDVQVRAGVVDEFLAGFHREIPISPVWLCPLRQRQSDVAWELYRLDPEALYVNVGFWSSVPRRPGMDPAHHNRWVEGEVDRLGGRKSLYSTVFYDEDQFWQRYNGPVYQGLKRRYDPDDRLLDLYAKCAEGG